MHEVKENASWRAGVAPRWLAAAAALSAAGLALVWQLDAALPAPRLRAHSPPHEFCADAAYAHLVNLTALGPRVAGSYENEVAAVRVVLAAAREAQRHAAPHNAVELDLHTASGAFSLSFFDGMNNVYRDVQSVVARVRAVGEARRSRTALLLNCHFDTVADSPGASDDGAGCAVLLELLRALAATPRPLRHDVLLLFNGAEENIMQASHAFITTHKWARSVRAFINIEACGAGGREVLFQAGPRDPWIMEVYSSVVPHPFASSLAQELFESGLIPADTDFRIFRDFGNLSGVDLAWSSNGYVYHTHLDTAERVPLGALQRTGDNVLALVHGLLGDARLERPAEDGAQPVFFDVLGAGVVCARAPAAALAAGAALALLAALLRRDAKDARKHLYVGGAAWWAALGAALLGVTVAGAAGLAYAAGVAAATHAAGRALAYYARPWLLAPLYGLPAVLVSWLTLRWALRRVRVGAVPVRGAWAARLTRGAVLSGWALLLLVALLARLRSGFLPLLWVLLPSAALHVAHLTGAGEGAQTLWWGAGCALPMLQTWYLAVGSLKMFVPIAGRAGTAPLPADVLLALLTGALALAACSWLLPLAGAARRGAGRAARAALGACALLALGAAAGLAGAPYCAARPQRLMLLHARRTLHGAPPAHSAHYWMPHLDTNTPHSLADHEPELAAASFSAAECGRWPYCGAPYILPVLGLVSRGYWAPTPEPPPLALRVSARVAPLNATVHELHLNVSGPASHVVVVVSPAAGARVSWSSLLAAPAPAAPFPAAPAPAAPRLTYFFALHAARDPRDWHLTMHIQHSFQSAPAQWAALSVAGHAPAGPRGAAHAALLARLPAWVAPTGWPVDLHLLTV